jgi:hypothetical protein
LMSTSAHVMTSARWSAMSSHPSRLFGWNDKPHDERVNHCLAEDDDEDARDVFCRLVDTASRVGVLR